jgi:hypothetical protein
LGGTVFLVPQGKLSYQLNYRGEPLQAYSRGINDSAGLAGFAEYDLIRYLYVGFAFQIMPSIKWASTSSSSTDTNSFGGTARMFDFLPHLGVAIPTTPRFSIVAFAAPGYSFFSASDFAGTYTKLGTARGFVIQAGGGVRYAFGQHGFFEVRGNYQRNYHNEKVQSSTTGESADAQFRFNFLSLHGSGGYWF